MAPQPVTKAEISTLKAWVGQGRDGIERAYSYLKERGYTYSSLALGVLKSDTLAGAAALSFMQRSAEQQGVNMPKDTERKINAVLAMGYLTALESQIGNGIGEVTRDITGIEAWEFHNRGFKEHGLSPDTWTLNTPFSILMKHGGEAAVEKAWQHMQESNLSAIASTSAMMGYFAKYGANEGTRSAALSWISRMPGYTSLEKLGNGLNFLKRLIIDGYIVIPLSSESSKALLASDENSAGENVSFASTGLLLARLAIWKTTATMG